VIATLSRLAPAVPAERLYPANAAYMARTDLWQTRMLGFKPFYLDVVTTLLMGLLNGRPTVRHRSGASDEILAVLDRAGLEVAEDMRIYERPYEAEQIAQGLVEEGYKLFWPYPLPGDRYPEGAHLVEPGLWRRLNAKQNLDAIVPAANLAPRQLVSLTDLKSRAFERPVFLKAGGDAPTGAGVAVRSCTDQASWLDAIDWFKCQGEIESVIVENDVPVSTCWCVTILVEANVTTCIGAAEQIFQSAAQQSGSVIDRDNPLPPAGAELAVQVGEAARRQGFVGIAGLDIALAHDGRLVVFDPNFRFNASSTQVLLHGSASRRGGFSASASLFVTTQLELIDVVKAARGPIDDGWFVPTRLIDAALLPEAEGISFCTGFVLGDNREEAIIRQRDMEKLLTK
jgi:hypothetical protein